MSRSRTQISFASNDWSPIIVSCTGAHPGASPGRPYKLRSLRNSKWWSILQAAGRRGVLSGRSPQTGSMYLCFGLLVWHNQRSLYQRLWLTPRSKASPLWADGVCMPRWHCWLVWKKQSKYVLWRTDKNEIENREIRFPVTESYPKQPVMKVSWWRKWSHAWGWQPSCVLCSVSSCGASWWEDALHQGILWENLPSWQQPKEVVQIIGKSGKKPGLCHSSSFHVFDNLRWSSLPWTSFASSWD